MQSHKVVSLPAERRCCAAQETRGDISGRVAMAQGDSLRARRHRDQSEYQSQTRSGRIPAATIWRRSSSWELRGNCRSAWIQRSVRTRLFSPSVSTWIST